MTIYIITTCAFMADADKTIKNREVSYGKNIIRNKFYK